MSMDYQITAYPKRTYADIHQVQVDQLTWGKLHLIMDLGLWLKLGNGN